MAPADLRHSIANNSEDGVWPEYVPVLIIGGGPVGLLQALLLSRLGVKSLVIERYPERLAAPKAHAINPRSLEICRQFGLDAKGIRKVGSPRADAHWVNFVTNLSGVLVGRLPYERMDTAVLEDTPEMIHNIPQPLLEQHFATLIAKDPNIQLRKGFSFSSLKQTPEEVTTSIEERGKGKQYQVRSRYVIACDGRRSEVRQALNIPTEGEDSDQTMMTIHFNADLRSVVKERVGMLYWILDPAAAGFIIGYNLDGNQVHISQVEVTQHPVETWTEEMCRTKIQSAIGQNVPFEIFSFRPWVFRREIATTFQVGNVFLAGDAAHSFPPTGGLGLNCGLADTHNLAYKIALVDRGVAHPSLLSSYTHERRQVADVYSRQSVKNGQQIFGLLRSVKTVGVDDIDLARRNMMDALNDPVQRARVDDGIEKQREHFDNLELHIGYVYGSSKTPANASTYSPKFIAGARLPHAWISFPAPDLSLSPKRSAYPALADPIDVSYVAELYRNQVDLDTRRWSILDLCAPDAFTIITGSSDAGAGENTPESNEPRILQVQDRLQTEGLRIDMWTAGRSFNFVGDHVAFAREVQLDNGGGLIVRPDQHILMTFDRATTASEMISALQEHLGV